jgi:hypothetical protein
MVRHVEYDFSEGLRPAVNAPGQIIVPQTTFGELGIVTGDFNSDGLVDVLLQSGGGMDEFIHAP